jgi:hypothetical protein
MQRSSRAAAGRARPAAGPGLGHALVLFAVGFALRAAYAWVVTGPGSRPYSDPIIYDNVAWNLARGAGFALEGGGVLQPTAFPPPLVPWITSLLYRIVGHDYFAGILLQCAVGALVPLLVAAFGTRMFGSGVGTWAGWVAAVNPSRPSAPR